MPISWGRGVSGGYASVGDDGVSVEGEVSLAFLMARSTIGSMPAYVTSGEGQNAGSSGTLNIPFPSTTVTNPKFVLQYGHLNSANMINNNIFVSAQDEWFTFASAKNSNTQHFLMFADNVHQNTTIEIRVSATAAARHYGIIHIFKNCVQGPQFYENKVTRTATDVIVRDASVRTTDLNRLAVNVINYSSTSAVAGEVMVGASGGTWVLNKAFSDNAPSAFVETAICSVATIVRGGDFSANISTSGQSIIHGFALLPALVVA